MFELQKLPFGRYSIYRIINKNNKQYFDIIPEMGGMIHDIGLKINNRIISIIDGYVSSDDIDNNLEASFKGSLLFPFPNRIKGGHYTFAESEYQLPINFVHENNSIHGLVYSKKIEYLSFKTETNKASIKLQYNYSGMEAYYPFSYKLNIRYSLYASSKTVVSTHIINTGNSKIPVALGWHPYFKTGSNLSEVELKLNSSFKFLTDSNFIPTGKKQVYKAFNKLSRIGNTHFDSCFELNASKKVELIDERKKIRLSIGFIPGLHSFNYIQLYTPPNRKSIAIEPMTCIPNAFNNKTGLVVLSPKASKEYSFYITASEI